MLFHLPLPLPVGEALELAAATGERMISCSPVAFNDIKHLARSMPADGLEAQDVGPPRCGCWVAHIAIFFVAAIGFWAKHTRSRANSISTNSGKTSSASAARSSASSAAVSSVLSQ